MLTHRRAVRQKIEGGDHYVEKSGGVNGQKEFVSIGFQKFGRLKPQVLTHRSPMCTFAVFFAAKDLFLLVCYNFLA